MFKTPSSKRGGRSSTKAPFTPRKKGLFEDGQWLCTSTLSPLSSSSSSPANHRLSQVLFSSTSSPPLLTALFPKTGDCRKPALFLTVKKEGANKGKHFYTCDTKRCDFFLWEQDAKARERDALLTHNCRSENGIVGRIQAKGEPPATPTFAPRSTTTTTTAYPPPPKTAPQQRIFTGAPQRRGSVSQDSDYLSYDTDEGDETQQAHAGSFGGGSSQTTQNGARPPSAAVQQRGRMPDFACQAATPSAKRKRSVFLPDSSDEEFGGSVLDDSEVERELAAATDESVRKKLFQTPAAERTVDRIGGGGLPTPATRTGRNSLLIADEDHERSSKRPRFTAPGSIPEDNVDTQSQLQSLPAGQGHALYIGDVGTPTPYRSTDALAPSAAPASTVVSPFKTSTGSDYLKIADEVMALLAGQPVSEATRRSVRQAMERHEMRVKGVVMGRDAARGALEARDGRIAELQARVVALENARRFDRGRLRELSEGLMHLTQEEEE